MLQLPFGTEHRKLRFNRLFKCIKIFLIHGRYLKDRNVLNRKITFVVANRTSAYVCGMRSGSDYRGADRLLRPVQGQSGKLLLRTYRPAKQYADVSISERISILSIIDTVGHTAGIRHSEQFRLLREHGTVIRIQCLMCLICRKQVK